MAQLTYEVHKRRRVQTGIPGLNEALSGGIPIGSTVALIGPPGVGKTIFGRQFLSQGLALGEQTLLFSTFESLEEAIEQMNEFGWGAAEKSVIYGDCYSWKYRKETPKYAASLKNLTEVGIMLNQIIEGEKVRMEKSPRLVIDSFSDFVLASGEEKAISLLSNIKPRLNEHKITALLMLEEGLHEQKVVSTVEYLTDGTIFMKQDQDERLLMVSRMLSTPVERKWMKFKIRNGIEMRMAAFFQ